MKKLLFAPLWIHALVAALLGGALTLLILASNARSSDESLRVGQEQDTALMLSWCAKLRSDDITPKEALVRARDIGGRLFIDPMDDIESMSKICAISADFTRNDFLVKRKRRDYVPITSCNDFAAPGGHLRYALRELACEELRSEHETQWSPLRFSSYFTIPRERLHNPTHRARSDAMIRPST